MLSTEENNHYAVDTVSVDKENHTTVEPRFNELLFNKVLDITNKILRPSQSYTKMYGIKPRYNEFFDITNSLI